MSLAITEQELIQRALESRIGDVFTQLPGRVHAFYGRTVDVEIVITRPIKTEAGEIKQEDFPILPNLIICYPSGGGFSITWDLAKGDHLVVLVMTYALTTWRKTLDISAPGDLRLHHLANSVALPFLPTPLQESPPGEEEIDPPPTLLIKAPSPGRIVLGDIEGSSFAARADTTDSNFDLLKNAISAAAVTPGDGGAAFKSNILSYISTIPSVASTKVKIK